LETDRLYSGLWSNIRQQILPQHGKPIETGDLAYRGTFARSQLEALKDPRVTELCSREEVTAWFGPNRHAVFYPLKGGEEFNLVLLGPDDLPENVRTQPGDIEEMQAFFEEWDDM
jgi:salicylate hydroxylase